MIKILKLHILIVLTKMRHSAIQTKCFSTIDTISMSGHPVLDKIILYMNGCNSVNHLYPESCTC